MNKGMASFGLVFAIVLLVGCASTRMTSQANQELAGHSFSRILVHGNFESLELRKTAEETLCSELLQTTPIECLIASEVFFPGQEFSMEQTFNRLAELQVDGVLTIQPTGSGTTSSYIPQSSSTTGSAYSSGNMVTSSSRTQTYGGYSVSKPWASFEVTLYSIATGKVAWYATADTGGNAYAGWNTLVTSVSSKSVYKLIEDGVLPKTPGNNTEK